MGLHIDVFFDAVGDVVVDFTTVAKIILDLGSVTFIVAVFVRLLVVPIVLDFVAESIVVVLILVVIFIFGTLVLAFLFL